MELPLVDAPVAGEHISISIIDEQLRSSENALRQLKDSIEDGQKQIAQLNANSYAVQGQIAVLKEVRKKIMDFDTSDRIATVASQLPPK